MTMERKSNSRIVALEGNIASGKSVLARALHDKKVAAPGGHKLTVRAQMENIHGPYLELFLADQRKHAFGLQFATLIERLYAIQLTRLSSEADVLHLLDRSILGDVVFAIMHHCNGNISDAERAAYYAKAKASGFGAFLFEQLDSVLYLHTHPDRCKQSLNARDDVDKGTERTYLADLDFLHVYALLKLLLDHPRVKVSVANWTAFGTAEHALSQLFEHRAALSRGTVEEYSLQIEAGTAVLLDAKSIDKPIDKHVATVLVPFDLQLEKLPEGRLAHAPGTADTRRVHSQAWRDAVFGSLGHNRAVVLVGPLVSCLLDVFDKVMTSL